MTWKYDAEEIIPAKLTVFLPVNIILVFIALLLVTLFMLFPEKRILNQLRDVSKAYPIAVLYLENLIQQEPDNFYYRLLLINQDIDLGY